jgi:protein involved in polysaccharide export with SLBB domain
MKLNWIGLWVAFCLAGLVAGCASSDGNRTSGRRTACALDELRQGDLVTVTFSDSPDITKMMPEQRIKVKDDGTLSLPMGLTLLVAGKKLGVVEKEIVALYVPKYYRQLTVNIKPDDRFYFVGGEVKTPGRQVYMGETTVLRAIQSCGDFTDFANKSNVQIHRANGVLEIIDCKKAIKNPKFDAVICPGDSIIVRRRLV